MIRRSSSFASRQTISAVHEASVSTRLTVAEQRVVVVVVDVEDVGAVALEEVDRHAVDVSAVEEDEGAVVDVGGRLVEDVGQRQEAVLERQRELLRREEHHRVLAHLPEELVEREERAEGVAVRALVRGQQEAVAVAKLRGDAFEVACWSSGGEALTPRAAS